MLQHLEWLVKIRPLLCDAAFRQNYLTTYLFMHSLADSVGEGIVFSGRPSAASVHSSGQILLPRLQETYREYSLAHTSDLIRF